MIDLNWYYTLDYPPFTPPVWVFPPAWVILYTLIFISLILFITKRTNQSKIAGYVLFFVQMFLNIIWTPVFFTFHNVGLALVVIILLDIVLYLNIREFYEISKKSAYFLIPYLVWVLFAAYLNFGVFLLN